MHRSGDDESHTKRVTMHATTRVTAWHMRQPTRAGECELGRKLSLRGGQVRQRESGSVSRSESRTALSNAVTLS